MTDREASIDWSLTTFEGSRRAQLRRWAALTVRQRLEALDEMTDTAQRLALSRAAAAPDPSQSTQEELRISEPSSRYDVHERKRTPERNIIPLPGCTPTPLASYLKALAVLRLVAEASPEDGGDPEATGYWHNDVFVLCTRLTAEELRTFFLEHYRPTPLLSPWNGRAGFLEGVDDDENENDIENTEESGRIGEEMVRTFSSDTIHDRFIQIRTAINVFHKIPALNMLNVGRANAKALDAEIKQNKNAGHAVAKEDEERLKKLLAENKRLKAEVLLRLRNEASEAWLSWFDACQSLAQTSNTKQQDINKPLHAPLLGKGGVDGSMDFGVNFQKRITQLFDLTTGEPLENSLDWLEQSLFSKPTNLIPIKPGQFDPGAGSFPNSGNGYLGQELGNPWNSMLSLEGCVMFATVTSRRLESSEPGLLSAPFTVRSHVSGSGAAHLRDESDKLTNAEMWMPIWSAPASYNELCSLFTEVRASVNGRSARDGLDFARAVSQLGVDRGVQSFQRFGFLKRFGKTFLAAPLFRVPVTNKSNTDLISDLDNPGWLSAVQVCAKSKLAPESFRSAVERLDTALFALAQQDSTLAIVDVLRSIGRIESVVTLNENLQKSVQPIPPLSNHWALKLKDTSSTFHIALALSGLYLRGQKQVGGRTQKVTLTARQHLARIDYSCRSWDKGSHLAIWRAGSLQQNLAALLLRRRLEAAKLGAEGETLASSTGATCDDIAAFLAGETDDARIAELFAGLACVDLHDLEHPQGGREPVLPPAFALLKIFFTSEKLLHGLKLDWLPGDRTVRLPAEIPARLAAGDVQKAVALAWHRLRSFGVKLPGRDPPRVIGANGPRWLAALCIPLTFGETGRLIRALDLNAKMQPEASTESTV